MALSNPNKRSYDPLVFWISTAVVIAFLLWGTLFPKNMSAGINAVFGWTTNYWGWLYLLTAFLLVGACFILICTSFLSSADSAAVSLAMFTSAHENPSRNLRAFRALSRKRWLHCLPERVV